MRGSCTGERYIKLINASAGDQMFLLMLSFVVLSWTISLPDLHFSCNGQQKPSCTGDYKQCAQKQGFITRSSLCYSLILQTVRN